MRDTEAGKRWPRRNLEGLLRAADRRQSNMVGLVLEPNVLKIVLDENVTSCVRRNILREVQHPAQAVRWNGMSRQEFRSNRQPGPG